MPDGPKTQPSPVKGAQQVSVEPVKDTAAKNRARRKFRRRVSAGLLLLIALVVAGGLAFYLHAHPAGRGGRRGQVGSAAHR